MRLRRAPIFESIVGRAVLLVPTSLALWWFVLKPASIWLLRVVAYVPLLFLLAPAGQDPVRVDPNTGEWLFNVAVNSAAKDARTGQSRLVDSAEFAATDDTVLFFAAGWFSYVALGVSAGVSRIQMRRVATGMVLQTGIAVVSLAACVYINGNGVLVNTDPSLWLVRYAYHLIYLVVPFAVALLLHPEWREYAGLAGPQRRPAVIKSSSTRTSPRTARS